LSRVGAANRNDTVERLNNRNDQRESRPGNARGSEWQTSKSLTDDYSVVIQEYCSLCSQTPPLHQRADHSSGWLLRDFVLPGTGLLGCGEFSTFWADSSTWIPETMLTVADMLRKPNGKCRFVMGSGQLPRLAPSVMDQD
jgi:hypothetical protein